MVYVFCTVVFQIVAKRRKLDNLSESTPAKSEKVPDKAQTVVRFGFCRYIIYGRLIGFQLLMLSIANVFSDVFQN